MIDNAEHKKNRGVKKKQRTTLYKRTDKNTRITHDTDDNAKRKYQQINLKLQDTEKKRSRKNRKNNLHTKNVAQKESQQKSC